MATFPFIGAAYTPRSKEISAEQCINLYPEMNSPASKSPMALLGTPGKRLWATCGAGPIRGMLRFSTGIGLVVSGDTVYKVQPGGAVAPLAPNIRLADTPVKLSSNGTLVFLVCGPDGYVIDPAAGTVSAVKDPDFIGADFVGYLDGYFVMNKTGTDQFQITGLLNTDLDALDFASAEGAPDKLLSLLVDHREIWLFGETSTEVWYNSGNADFPMERIQGAFIEQGIAAKFSAAKLDNTVYWLSFDENGQGMVLRATGYNPQRVSDHGIEYAIARMSTVSDAEAWTYQSGGHQFYVLSFPTEEQTWVFDPSSNLWHQRAWRDPAINVLKADRARCRMNFDGEVLVGDRINGNVYVLDDDYYTDNGDSIARIRACPHLFSANDYEYQVFDSLEIDMETGVGLSVAPGAPNEDPQAILQWSDDGGYTWSNDHRVSMGKIGQRKVRARWRRLGKARDRIFKLTITDAVKVALVSAVAKVRLGR